MIEGVRRDLVVDDAAFARVMEERFGQDLEAATRIEPQAWRKRGIGSKLKEWVARQWQYML